MIEIKKLRCDMRRDCSESVTHIDVKGFLYCRPHALQRVHYVRCRQLKPKELKQLQFGQPIAKY